MDEAKTNCSRVLCWCDALADLAEGVSIQVSSTSVLHTIETRQGLTEIFDQQIQVSTDDYLEGFEPVDFYENENSYWYYYKINENTYREKKALRKKKAVDIAKAKYTSGKQEENSEKPKEALTFYLQGLDAIYRYLGEETNTNFNGSNVDIGNELYSSINQVLSLLKIKSDFPEIDVKRGEDFNHSLMFSTLYNNTPVQSIPVKFSYTGGYLKKDHDISNQAGSVELSPWKIVSKKNQEQLSATINLQDISAKAVDNLFIRALINDYEIEVAQVNISIKACELAISVPEQNCIPEQCNQIIKSFNKIAVDEGYGIQLKENADFVFFLNFQYSNGESAGGLHAVYLNGDLLIKDKNKKAVWAKKIMEIKGVAEDIEAARGKAFAEIVRSLDKIYFKQGITAIN